MRVLGIDPGAVRLGWGYVERKDDEFTLMSSGVVSLPQGPDEKFGEYRRRVACHWWDDFPRFMHALGAPDLIASETLPAKGSGNFINPQTEAVKAAITAMQIGAHAAGKPPWEEIASSTVKKRVFGMASKPPKAGTKKRIKVSKVDMRNAVQAIFPELKERDWETDLLPDEVDAIAVALAAAGYKARDYERAS